MRVLAIIATLLLFIFFIPHINAHGDEYLSKLENVIDASKIPDNAKNNLKQSARDAVNKGIPAAELKIITERHLDAGMAPEALSKWFRIITETSGKGLPINPVMDKIKEGIAKNIQPVRIEKALDLVIERLGYSKEVINDFVKSGKIRPEQSTEAVEILSETLWRGIPAESLKEVCQYVKSSRKEEDTFSTMKVSALSLGKMQSLNIPLENSMGLIKDVLEKSDYRNYYLYDLVEVIRIALAQKKRTQGEILDMAKNSVAKNVQPVQLAEIMKLGSEGLTLVQVEITKAEKDIAALQKQVDEASAKVKQGMENAREELERATEELKKNLERMRELKELMERMREEIEHIRYYHELYGE